jgi:hypothetical protein
MTKRKIKKHITKRKNAIKATKKIGRLRMTRKNKYINKYGGEPFDEYKKAKIKGKLVSLLAKKNLFRRTLNNFIIQIKNGKNKLTDSIKNSKYIKKIEKSIENAVDSIIETIEMNKNLINTLIPVTIEGKPVDKETYSLAKNPVTIYEFVSPVTVIFDNLTDIIPEKDIIKILNAYFLNGGNFNNLSSKLKESPFQHEIKKQRVNNVKMLLNKSNPFHIIEDGLDEETKKKLSELIPNEQQITNEQQLINEQQIEEPVPIEETVVEEPVVEDKPIINEKLTLPFPIPQDNDIGYDRTVVPEFWKPIFQNGEELLEIREKFLGIYEIDSYKDDTKKQIQICDILERTFPAYLTKYTLGFKETAETLVNVNILNCFITLFYGIILYRLYDTKQDYVFMFKGGRALQLSLVDIADIGKYFSEDTDILIIPNRFVGGVYDLEKMENLSEHIAYLIKWMIPQEINVYVSLPTNPKNTNKDITKLLYNENKLFKALSDIGFGEMNEDIKGFFENLSYSTFYVDDLESIALFITPTLDDMLAEKLFYYAKYFKFKSMLTSGETIIEREYSNLTIGECDRILLKFKRAIVKLVEAILKRDYSDVTDLNETESKKLILRGFIVYYNDYSNQEKEDIIISIFQQINS